MSTIYNLNYIKKCLLNKEFDQSQYGLNAKLKISNVLRLKNKIRLVVDIYVDGHYEHYADVDIDEGQVLNENLKLSLYWSNRYLDVNYSFSPTIVNIEDIKKGLMIGVKIHADRLKSELEDLQKEIEDNNKLNLKLFKDETIMHNNIAYRR